MREAARALDDVSDHLGEVLRRADELLAEWSRFGAQVRAQVEREAAAIGEVVDGAVGRAAAGGLDRAIGDRLRALTGELERLEQRTRAASRVAVEQRATDRRLIWAVVAGIALANALLVVLLLRRPEPAAAAEPVRIEPATAARPPVEAAPAPTVEPLQGSAAPAAGSAAEAVAPATGAAAMGGSAAAPAGAGGASGATAGSSVAPAGGQAGSAAAATSGKPGAGGRAAEAGPKASAISLPPRPGAARPHKKLP